MSFDLSATENSRFSIMRRTKLSLHPTNLGFQKHTFYTKYRGFCYRFFRGSMNDQRKHSLNALGSGASKPASAAHGFKGPVALELPCEDAPPGTLLTTDPSQDTDDRDTTDVLYDTGK